MFEIDSPNPSRRGDIFEMTLIRGHRVPASSAKIATIQAFLRAFSRHGGQQIPGFSARFQFPSRISGLVRTGIQRRED
jgi:hypothetical protein